MNTYIYGETQVECHFSDNTQHINRWNFLAKFLPLPTSARNGIGIEAERNEIEGQKPNHCTKTSFWIKKSTIIILLCVIGLFSVPVTMACYTEAEIRAQSITVQQAVAAAAAATIAALAFIWNPPVFAILEGIAYAADTYLAGQEALYLVMINNKCCPNT